MAFKIYGSKSKWRPWVLDGGKRALKVAIPVIACLWVLVLLFNSIGIWGKDDTEMDSEELPNFQGRKEELYSLDEMTESSGTSQRELDLLPRGIVEATSNMDLRSLWAKRNSTLTDYEDNARCLLAIPVGIKLKKNVDMVAKKFFAENFIVILFHYDGNVDEWGDLKWHNKAIHIVAHNQSKWWFAKRFLHPDVISTYDYIFIWDEDLGVDNFHPGRPCRLACWRYIYGRVVGFVWLSRDRYLERLRDAVVAYLDLVPFLRVVVPLLYWFLKIMKEEGLEISQPALDPDLSEEIHHRITMRNKTGRVHRRIYGTLGGKKCSNESQGPPCTGWVEMMAPVFSRAAWRCAWHLIQNDLVHGWGLDMKLGYCAQGDRTKKVGVIDSEYIVHQGIQTLGGSGRKAPIVAPPVDPTSKANRRPPVDVRVEIRRQSGAEWETFKRRWDRAVKEDKDWVDPFRPKPEKSAATRPHMILSIVPRAISRLIPTRHGLVD